MILIKNTCFVLDFESYLICRKITCTLGGVTCETSKNRKKKSSDTRIYIEVGNGKEGQIGLETRVWANFEVNGPFKGVVVESITLTSNGPPVSLF